MITAPTHTATLQHTLQHTHKCLRNDKLNKRNTRVQKDCHALPHMEFAELFLKIGLFFSSCTKQKIEYQSAKRRWWGSKLKMPGSDMAVAVLFCTNLLHPL